MKLLRFLSLAALLLGSLPSWSQDEGGGEWATKKTKQGTVKFKKKTEYSFEGAELEGQLKSPTGAMVSTRKKVQLDSLIKLRTNFDQEVEGSLSGTR